MMTTDVMEAIKCMMLLRGGASAEMNVEAILNSHRSIQSISKQGQHNLNDINEDVELQNDQNYTRHNNMHFQKGHFENSLGSKKSSQSGKHSRTMNRPN